MFDVKLCGAMDLKVFRLELDLTQSQLGARLGVHQTRISELERWEGPIPDLELPGKLEAIRLKLRPPAPVPPKIGKVQERKNAELRAAVAYQRELYAKAMANGWRPRVDGPSTFEAFITRDEMYTIEKGGRTRKDVEHHWDVVDFARANNLL